MKKYILHLFLLLAVMVIPSFAVAEDCAKINQNRKWLDGMNELSNMYTNGSYQQVITKGKELSEICSLSPTLNFFIAKAYHETGDKQKELYYLQIATRNSQFVEVPADLLEKMWRDRMYLEYPDISPESVEALKEEIDSLKAGNEALTSQMMSDNRTALVDNSSEAFNYKTMMWSGVGVGSAGVVFIAAGAALVALQKDKAVEFNDLDNPTKARAGGKYVAGWGLLGAGITAVVVGGALSGLSAYYLSKTKQDDLISFDISPVSAGMTIKF